MNLNFWKKKPAGDTDRPFVDDDKTVAINPEKSPGEDLAHPSPGARLGYIFTALAQRLRRKRDAGPGESEVSGVPEAAEAATHSPPPRNLKKRLVIGGALGAAVLLLTGIGFAAWKTLFSTHDTEPPHPAEVVAHGGTAPAKPANAETEMQAQLEALKKQNEEMASQLETLKKRQEEKNLAETLETPQPPPAAPPQAGPAPGNGSNEVTIFSGKDPKASAQALRQAIAEMNAATPDGIKPRKPDEATTTQTK